ncbi:MAG: DUF2442 domain-containing protein [Anaerolineae bacterium]
MRQRRLDGQQTRPTILTELSDGREISVPVNRIGWLAWLARATPEQREKWTLAPNGYAICWEALDDGIEVEHILAIEPLA